MPTPDHFDRFKILRPLRNGAMGRTFLAYDPARGEEVVLKLLSLDAEKEIFEAQRLGCELQKLASTRTQQVPAVYDSGKKDGHFYVAMQYVVGRDCSSVLKDEGRVEPEIAAHWVRQVCDILTACHELQGTVDGEPITAVVHSDIKLENLRLTRDGRVFLIDFGTAKGLSVLHGQVQNDYATPPNTPPEYWESGRMVNQRTDLWAASVVLYRLVCGHSPFVEPSRSLSLEERDQEISEAIRLAQLRPVPKWCPSELRNILSRALAHTPTRRYPSAAAFAADLDAYLAGLPLAPETQELETPERDERTRRTFQPGTAEPPAHGKWKSLRKLKFWLSGSLLMVVLLGGGTQIYAVRLADQAIKEVATKAEPDLDRASALLARARFWSVLPLKIQDDQFYLALMRDAEVLFTEYRENRRTVLCSEWLEIKRRVDEAVKIYPHEAKTKARQLYVHGQIKRIAARQGCKGQGKAKLYEAVRLLDQAAEIDLVFPDPFLALIDIYASDQGFDYERLCQSLEAARRRGHQATTRQRSQLASAHLKRCLRLQKDASRRREEREKRPLLEQAMKSCEDARLEFDQLSAVEDVQWSLNRSNQALEQIRVALAALNPPTTDSGDPAPKEPSLDEPPA